MTVSPNHAPSAAALIFPISGQILGDAEPRLVVQNAEDADLDPLTYFFELDTVDTFDSADLRESGPVEEVPGVTFWYPGELAQGTYFWRAWVSDGMADTEPMVANFEVYLGIVEVPDSGADGGMGDATIDPDVGITPPPRERSGCSASGSPAPLSAWALLFGLAWLGRARRRDQ